MNDGSNLLNPEREGNWWSRRSTKGKSLIVVGLLAFLTAIVLIVVFTVNKKTPPGNTPETPEATTTAPAPILTCDTDACKEAAKIIGENINNDVNPCDDFYEFACGKYKDLHPIPDDKSAVGAFDLLQTQVENRVKEIIKSMNEKTLEDAKDSTAVKYVKTMYGLCTDTDKMEKTGLAPLKALVKDLGDWKQAPTNDPDNSEDVQGFEDPKQYLEKMAKLIGETGSSGIISVSIQPDDFAPQKNIFHIDQPSFMLGREDLTEPEKERSKKLIAAYKEYIAATGELMEAAEIKNKVDKIVEFETELAKASTPVDDRRDPFMMTNKLSVKDLKDKAPGIDYLQFLNQVLKAAGVKDKILTENDQVIVYDIKYVQALMEILKKYEDDIIEDYLGLLVLNRFGSLTTQKFRDNKFKFTQVRTGLKSPPPQEDACVNLLAGTFDFVIGRLYVDKYFSDEEKKKSTEVVTGLSDAFKSFLPSHEWLDEETRKAADDKANKITKNMGYPDFIKDNKELDKTYPFPNLKDADAVRQYRKALETFAKESFKKLNQDVNWAKEWPMGPALVNAAYMPSQNSITFPAGILQGVFFDAGKPSSLNFGALGVVAGHEISHGFDDQGASYAADGSLKNWWSESSKKNFKDKAKCFEDQYSAIKDEQTGLQLNGLKTLGENIADNGGVHQAFAAYRKVAETKDEGVLPGLTQYNHDQLFFLGHANVWCLNANKEYAENRILYNEHSLGRYRVNVPLMNSPDFAKAFSCEAGTKMNPEKRCSLW